MAVIAKTASGLDAAVRKAEKQANRTGKAVEVHYYRETSEGRGGRYKAYYDTIYPTISKKSNPLPKGKFFKVTKAKINPNGSVSLVVPQSSLKKNVHGKYVGIRAKRKKK